MYSELAKVELLRLFLFMSGVVHMFYRCCSMLLMTSTVVVQFLEVGRVSSMQVNHKPVEKAVKGQDVCIKIDPVPGEAPKMYGRHFEHTDLLVSKVCYQLYIHICSALNCQYTVRTQSCRSFVRSAGAVICAVL